jgi:phosphotransferase system enzyme I (PtsI)
MKKIAGIGASKGIAIGRLTLCASLYDNVRKESRADVEKELGRLYEARKSAVEELDAIYRNALERIGEENSAIFRIHVMMLQDEEFFGSIREIVTEEKVNAEYAVWKAGKKLYEMFANMEDEYMRGRAADVIDITKRLIRCLNKGSENSFQYVRNRILGTADIMPSETVQMKPEKVLAFVTQEGSKNSHSAILARTMGIPAVVGLVGRFSELSDGVMTIVDGTSGEVILEPDQNTLEEYRMKQAELARLDRAE